MEFLKRAEANAAQDVYSRLDLSEEGGHILTNRHLNEVERGGGARPRPDLDIRREILV